MQLTDEQRRLLAEIRRLDALTFADAVEADWPDVAEQLRERYGDTTD